MNAMEKLMYCSNNCKDLARLNNQIALKDVEIKLLKERITELEAMVSSGETDVNESNNRRISKEKELEIVKQYYDGKSISLIGRELEVARNTVYKTLRRNNIDV